MHPEGIRYLITSFPPSCGNGFVEDTEECDLGVSNGVGPCNTNCTHVVCGNGAPEPTETCDDGNTISGDGCDSVCQSEVCADGKIDQGEECDDENTEDGDGCDSGCFIEVCGNERVQVDEDCDRGPLNGQEIPGEMGCNNDCSFPHCGDGVIEATGGEDCDFGAMNGQPGVNCDATCRFAAECGNGIVEPGEGCDNGLGGNGNVAVPVPGAPDFYCTATCTLFGCYEGIKTISFDASGNSEEGENFISGELLEAGAELGHFEIADQMDFRVLLNEKVVVASKSLSYRA